MNTGCFLEFRTKRSSGCEYLDLANMFRLGTRWRKVKRVLMGIEKVIPTELELLELAKKHIKQYSLRQVAAWLTTQSGKSISHHGLKKRLDVERKRKRITKIKRQYAKRLEKALRQIEILEKERTGAYTYEEESGDSDTPSASEAT